MMNPPSFTVCSSAHPEVYHLLDAHLVKGSHAPSIEGQVRLPEDAEPLDPALFFAKRLAFQVSKNEFLELWVTKINPHERTIFLGPTNAEKLAEALEI